MTIKKKGSPKTLNEKLFGRVVSAQSAGETRSELEDGLIPVGLQVVFTLLVILGLICVTIYCIFSEIILPILKSFGVQIN